MNKLPSNYILTKKHLQRQGNVKKELIALAGFMGCRWVSTPT